MDWCTKQTTDLCILAACFLCSLLIGWSYAPDELPLLGDNQHQFFIAERAASGLPPHISQFSAKHSLSFLLTAAAISSGRWLGLSDIWSARILSLLIFSASVSLTALVAHRLVKSRAAAVAAAFSMLTFAAYVHQAAMGSRPKVFLVFFMLLVLLAVSRNRPLWIGVGAALSFLCWQPALIMLVCASLLTRFQENKLRWLSLLGLGAAIPVFLYELYFFLNGILSEQLYQSYYFPAMFMSEHSRGIRTLFHLGSVWGRGFHPANPSPIFLVVALFAFWRELWQRRQTPSTRLVSRPGWGYLMVSLQAVLAFTIYDHQSSSDLFFLVPFLAVINGHGMTKLWSGWPNSRYQFPMRLLFVVIAGIFMILILQGPRTFDHSYTLQDQIDLAREVKALRVQHGEIYAIGCAHLLAFNDMNNWSQYSAFFRGVRAHLSTKAAGGPDVPWEAELLPGVVLISRYDRRLPPELDIVLKRDYRESTTPSFMRQDISVWIRR